MPNAGTGAHLTPLDLRKPISTTLIAFNGNDTGYTLWGCEEYPPVTNRNRLLVLFFCRPTLTDLVFLLAQYPRSSPALLVTTPLDTVQYEYSSIRYPQTPGPTPHLIILIYFKAPLRRSHRFTFLANTQPLLRIAIGSSLIFLFYFLPLIGSSLSIILLLSCIIDDYYFISDQIWS